MQISIQINPASSLFIPHSLLVQSSGEHENKLAKQVKLKSGPDLLVLCALPALHPPLSLPHRPLQEDREVPGAAGGRRDPAAGRSQGKESEVRGSVLI